MRNKLLVIGMSIICSFVLMACSDDQQKEDNVENEGNKEVQNEENTENKDKNDAKDEENKSEGEDNAQLNVPEDLILDAAADPVELKDQVGLKMGETGYAGKPFDEGVLAITLNDVDQTQKLSESSVLDGEKFYLIAEFTFENVSNVPVEIIRPDVVKASDESAVLNDEFNNGDLLGVGNGIGGKFLNDKREVPEGTPINTVTVQPGEKVIQNVSITMRESTDEYMVLFGFFDGNNKYYRNKVAWTLDAAELEN